MNDLSKKLKEFESSIFSIYNAADLRWSQLEWATDRAKDLIEEVSKVAKSNKSVQLQAFMLSILASLRLLQEVTVQSQNVQNEFVEGTEPLSLQHVMQNLSQVYHTHLEPMLDELNKQAQSGNLGKAFSQVAAFAALGSEVLECSTEIVAFRHQMDTKEKICAALGVIMMFAGLGLLLAATVNPATAPIMIPLVMISLGCFLCRRSVQRHKNLDDPNANKINEKLNKTAHVVDNVAKAFKQTNPARMFLFFSAKPNPELIHKQIKEQERKAELLKANINKLQNESGKLQDKISKQRIDLVTTPSEKQIVEIQEYMDTLLLQKEMKDLEIHACQNEIDKVKTQIEKLNQSLPSPALSIDELFNAPQSFMSKLRVTLRNFFTPRK